MKITIDNVRKQVAFISSERLSDETVSQQIDLAEALVSKASGKTYPTIETAVLLVSAVFCLQQYVEVVHRELGTEPTQMIRLVEYFRISSDIALRQIGVYDFWGAKLPTTLPGLSSMTESLSKVTQ